MPNTWCWGRRKKKRHQQRKWSTLGARNPFLSKDVCNPCQWQRAMNPSRGNAHMHNHVHSTALSLTSFGEYNWRGKASLFKLGRLDRLARNYRQKAVTISASISALRTFCRGGGKGRGGLEILPHIRWVNINCKATLHHAWSTYGKGVARPTSGGDWG